MMKFKHPILIPIFVSIFIFIGIIFYFIQKRNVVSEVKVVDMQEVVDLANTIGGDSLTTEDLEVEIVDETQSQTLENDIEEVEEEILEDDAEKLSINEENDDDPDGAELKNDEAETVNSLSPARINSNPNILKIGFITDLHANSNGSGILASYYTKKMNYFVEKMNNVFAPNFIMLGGDVIEGTKTSSYIGSKELSVVKNIFNRTNISKYWVIGNHDLRSVNKDQWMKTLGINYLTKSFEVGNYKIIILDSNFTKEEKNVEPGRDYLRGNVSEKQIKWLKSELKNTNKKIVVFMHHPPLRDIEAKPDVNLLYNARDLQDIFSKYDVLAVISGHIEDLYYQEIGGVGYFVSPGMVKYPKYLGAFSEITIDGKKINIELNYLKEDGTYRIINIKKK